jgi:mycofactocin system glycosyltransferase
VRFRPDPTWTRYGTAVLAGSPLRLFRLTAAGRAVAERIEQGDEVDPSGLLDRLLDAGAIHPDHARGQTPGVIAVAVVTPRLRRAGDGWFDAAPVDDRITVDDGSVPPLAGATVRLEVNAGPAAARNAGRAAATTELIAFVDDDVDAPDGWLDPLLAHFDDPLVGLVAPRVAGERGSPLDLGAEPARVRAGTRVSYVPGAAIVVRATAFDAIGGFDPTLRVGEDVDLVWRLDEAGWRCRYEPASVVWHRPRPTGPARLRQHAFYGTSAAALALRHPRGLAPVRTNGWTAFVWIAAVLGHPLVAVGVAIGSAAALPPRLPAVPARDAFVLALRGHLAGGSQFAEAARRVWWPGLAAAAIVSRRARWAMVLAVASGLRSTATDVAYGWGVWAGMCARRSWAPVIPAISAWPPRARRSRSASRRPPGAPRSPNVGAAR